MDRHDLKLRAPRCVRAIAYPARRRCFIRGALLATALALANGAHAQCSLKRMELPVHMVDTRAIATVTINGQAVPLIVDTGASFSLLTDAAAAQLHLSVGTRPGGIEIQGLTGRADVHVTTVDQVGLSKGSVPDVDFIVGGNEPGSGAMGLLGRNFLSMADAEYDLAHGVVRFVFPSEGCAGTNMAYWARDVVVSTIELLPEYHVEALRKIRNRKPPLRARASLDDKPIHVMFDSGATTMVTLKTAHELGVKSADMTPDHPMYGVGEGMADTWTARFPKFEIGGEAIANNRLEVGDFDLDDADMLLGIDFFLSHHIYVSRQQSRMFFTYNGGPVFALNVAPRAAPAASVPGDAAETLDADAYARRAAASHSRGDLAGALADLDRACSLEPAKASCFTERALVHVDLKQSAKAMEDLDQALRLDPGQAQARLQRAWLRQGKGDKPGAQDDLGVLDATLPPQSQTRMSMARLYSVLEQPARALGQWNQWIAAHPNEIMRPVAYNGRCWSRVLLAADLDKALDDCDEALRLDPRNPTFLDSRAWVHLRTGAWSKARADFDRGLAIEPDNAGSLYGRGLARLRLGEAAPSQADFRAARALQPDIDAQIRRDGLPAVETAAP